MPIYEDRPMQEFPDYIPYIRDDALAVRVNCRPKFNVTVSGIALPLYPAPDQYFVFVNCDWMPAIYWRKNAMFNHRVGSDWTVWHKVHVSRLEVIKEVRWSMNQWGHYSFLCVDVPGLIFQHEQFQYIESWWHIDDRYVRSIRSWTLHGWYVKDDAMPVCYHTKPDLAPPLFKYQDCIPLPGKTPLERRMKLLLRDWQPDFSNAGLQYRETNPNAARDDVEMAASEFCEGYDYRDFMGNRIDPSQKASAWLYTVFCASAGYLT